MGFRDRWRRDRPGTAARAGADGGRTVAGDVTASGSGGPADGTEAADSGAVPPGGWDGGWRAVPPPAVTVARSVVGVSDGLRFRSRLSAWRSPSVVGTLGHAVLPSAPPGLLRAVALPPGTGGSAPDPAPTRPATRAPGTPVPAQADDPAASALAAPPAPAAGQGRRPVRRSTAAVPPSGRGTPSGPAGSDGAPAPCAASSSSETAARVRTVLPRPAAGSLTTAPRPPHLVLRSLSAVAPRRPGDAGAAGQGPAAPSPRERPAPQGTPAAPARGPGPETAPPAGGSPGDERPARLTDPGGRRAVARPNRPTLGAPLPALPPTAAPDGGPHDGTPEARTRPGGPAPLPLVASPGRPGSGSATPAVPGTSPHPTTAPPTRRQGIDVQRAVGRSVAARPDAATGPSAARRHGGLGAPLRALPPTAAAPGGPGTPLSGPVPGPRTAAAGAAGGHPAGGASSPAGGALPPPSGATPDMPGAGGASPRGSAVGRTGDDATASPAVRRPAGADRPAGPAGGPPRPAVDRPTSRHPARGASDDGPKDTDSTAGAGTPTGPSVSRRHRTGAGTPRGAGAGNAARRAAPSVAVPVARAAGRAFGPRSARPGRGLLFQRRMAVRLAGAALSDAAVPAPAHGGGAVPVVRAVWVRESEAPGRAAEAPGAPTGTAPARAGRAGGPGAAAGRGFVPRTLRRLAGRGASAPADASRPVRSGTAQDTGRSTAPGGGSASGATPGPRAAEASRATDARGRGAFARGRAAGGRGGAPSARPGAGTPSGPASLAPSPSGLAPVARSSASRSARGTGPAGPAAGGAAVPSPAVRPGRAAGPTGPAARPAPAASSAVAGAPSRPAVVAHPPARAGASPARGDSPAAGARSGTGSASPVRRGRAVPVVRPARPPAVSPAVPVQRTRGGGGSSEPPPSGEDVGGTADDSVLPVRTAPGAAERRDPAPVPPVSGAEPAEDRGSGAPSTMTEILRWVSRQTGLGGFSLTPFSAGAPPGAAQAAGGAKEPSTASGAKQATPSPVAKADAWSDADVDALARRLVGPVGRLLRAELRRGRDRAGHPYDGGR